MTASVAAAVDVVKDVVSSVVAAVARDAAVVRDADAADAAVPSPAPTSPTRVLSLV